MADTKDTKKLYRLKGNLSRNEEGGRKIYGPGQPGGDLVRLTPAYAQRIGAELVDTGVSTGVSGGSSDSLASDDTVATKVASVKTKSDTSTPDWSTLSALSYEEAVSLVNSATSIDQLKEAREAETGTGGKKRRSVVEAITAKEKELAGDSK